MISFMIKIYFCVFAFTTKVIICETLMIECKVSREGTEYVGHLSQSRSGADCLDWSDAAKKGGEKFIDLVFADGAKLFAKNYCRNPSRDVLGPWCYVQKNVLEKEYCDIPFCHLEACRWTGPGEEYQGKMTKTDARHECVRWSETVFNDYELAESACIDTNSIECRSCRNVDGSIGGPWCLVETRGTHLKQLCNIPFCQDGPALVFGGESHYISNFYKLPLHSSEFHGQVRLWQPKKWLDGSIVIILSALDIAVDMKGVRNWGSVLIATLSNTGSALTGPEMYDRIDTPSILSAKHWTNISLHWKRSSDEGMVVSLYLNGGRKPLLVADIDTTATMLEQVDYQYFSVMGTMAFWNFLNFTEECLMTTTSKGEEEMWVALERQTGQETVQIYVRISQKVSLIFKESPTEPSLLQMHIFRSGRVILEDTKDRRNIHISDVEIKPFDYWFWENIEISILGDHLLAKRYKDSETEIMVNVSGIAVLRQVLWLGPSSNSVSHWTFNCDPKDSAPTPRPEPPECSYTKSGLEYNGTQYVTISGKHCMPWIDDRLPEVSNKLFNRFGGRRASTNFCRNLNMESDGPFCYIEIFGRPGERSIIEKELCEIRSCFMGECKHSGTGSDYFGHLSVTRSQRTCKASEGADTPGFCRNSDQNIGGPWCFTESYPVHKDFCYVKDCQRSASSIMLSSTTTINSAFYILPAWRKLGVEFWVKNWNPEHDASVFIAILPASGSSMYKLVLGGGSNEQLILSHFDGKKDTLLFELTAPQLVRSGGWTALWLRSALGSVELGHGGMEIPFFEWKSGPSEKNLDIEPFYLSFGSLNNLWVGISFRPPECLVERLWASTNHHLWPIDLWKNSEHDTRETSIEFFFQGSGIFAINLIYFPDESYVTLEVNDVNLFLFRNSHKKDELLNSTQFISPFLDEYSWKKLTIRFVEDMFLLETENGDIWTYTTNEEILIFYWFNIDVKSGWLAWAANCQPLDLGGEPRDGGWSVWGPWECSAPCGGGEGHRERTCDSPPPNLMGKECPGLSEYAGVCNGFPCGDIPPDLEDEIRHRLSVQFVSLLIEIGERAILPCNDDLAVKLRNNIPEAKFEWSLNGFPYARIKDTSQTFHLEQTDANINDSGVWACTASWSMRDVEKKTIVGIASLAVRTPHPTAIIRETETLSLMSNAAVLGLVYGHLAQRWELDGIVMRFYGPTSLSSVAIEELQHVNTTFEGIWTCVIEQEELGFKWTTAWIRVHVINAPNFWTHLIEDEATSPMFGSFTEDQAQIVFYSTLAVFLIVPIILCIIYNSL